MILTGGPAIQSVAAAAGARAWVGYARHMVVVTEPSAALHARPTAMAFDIGAGIYWRPEEGGFLWGMSNPDEEPGPGRSIDWATSGGCSDGSRPSCLRPAISASRRRGRRRSSTRPTTCRWSAARAARGTTVGGATIASVCGHGMMWGPAVSRIATDLALDTGTKVVERVEDFRMDRFDDEGNPPYIDPVALPFPVRVDD